jgi:hypothetical protein
MNEGQKVLKSSIAIFCTLAVVLLGFGFFVYPNLNLVDEKEPIPETQVLGAVEQQNSYAYECPETFPVIYVPEDFQTIQSAIDSVDQGAIIRVSPGVYNEYLVLKPNICLIAQEFRKTQLEGFGGTMITASGNNKIENFAMTSLGKGQAGILIENADFVNVGVNSFENFEYGVVSKNSKVSVNSNAFRDVETAVFFEESMFFFETNHIETFTKGMDVLNSEGDVVGNVFGGADYGVKSVNSKIFFDKNIFKNQKVGVILQNSASSEIGNNFFEEVDEEIRYE